MPIQHINLSKGASDYPEALSSYEGKAPMYRVLLWPHRSLPRGGFVFFIAITCIMLTFPLLPLIGTAAIWVLLPFLVLTVALLWVFIMRSYRSGQLVEELSLWPDHMTLVRRNPDGTRQDWEANPYWVEVISHDKPVEAYLTLRGGPREVEMGAFLTPEERIELKEELEDKLRFLAVEPR
ncbi:DUF2244 domain-containing protein [Litoreibacter janthinus]|uniref:Uncharacterized membrane protein n=1 Tax=Litoreibacter janthinus TaxID=670154 RepID=A0A1I6HDL1_9RHOB|nr:DUF2244 domain-containing protein [Litoreibacter janthinus]SFR52539.1 Uncharacterized membrane protein [Litoreibacter janthinus]